MNQRTKRFVLTLMNRHNIMSFATVRPDGFPQSTTVAYVNDGLAIYFACERDSQKIRNLKRSRKVSLTIDRDYKDWSKIKGLSMAATAHALTRTPEIDRAMRLLTRKFPVMKRMSKEEMGDIVIVKIVPKILSILDYSKGFGHTDLVRV